MQPVKFATTGLPFRRGYEKCGLALGACAMQPVPHGSDLPGFFIGLVHGFIAPFALIGEVFMDHRVYAFPNSGGWYDFGFLLGVGALTGGSGAASR